MLTERAVLRGGVRARRAGGYPRGRHAVAAWRGGVEGRSAEGCAVIFLSTLNLILVAVGWISPTWVRGAVTWTPPPAVSAAARAPEEAGSSVCLEQAAVGAAQPMLGTSVIRHYHFGLMQYKTKSCACAGTGWAAAWGCGGAWARSGEAGARSRDV